MANEDKKKSFFEQRIEDKANANIYQFFNKISDLFRNQEPKINLTKSAVTKALNEAGEEYGKFRWDIFFNRLRDEAVKNNQDFVKSETDKFFQQLENINYMFKNNPNNNSNQNQDYDVPF